MDHLGWEWIFFVNVPIGVIAIVLDAAAGAGLAAEALALVRPAGHPALERWRCSCIVFGVQNGQQYDWGTVWGGITVFEIIGAGVVLLVAFVVWQRFNKREPLLPLQVFSNRNFSAGTLTATTVGFAMTGMFLPLVIYIQSVLGLTPTMAGLLTAPMSLLSGIVAPFVGRASDKVNGKYLVMFGLAALAAGLGVIALQASPTSSPWSFIPALLMCGLGIGCIFSPMSNLTMGAVEPRLAGTASGIFNTSRQVGGVLGSAAIGVLLQAQVSSSIADEAAKAASQLPEQYRAPFTEGIAKAAASTGEFGSAGGPSPMPGLPAEIAAQAGKLASEAVHSGLTDAARVTMLLPMVVLLLGLISAAMLRQVKPRWATPAPAEPEAAARPEKPCGPPLRVSGTGAEARTDRGSGGLVPAVGQAVAVREQPLLPVTDVDRLLRRGPRPGEAQLAGRVCSRRTARPRRRRPR